MSDIRVPHGDNLSVERTVTNIPFAESMVKAWFTLKREKELLQPDDSPAVLQKVITQTAGTPGVIVMPGVPDGTGVVKFYIYGASDYVKIKSEYLYYYDIQVLLSGGGIYTPDSGTFIASRDVTKTTS